MRYSIIIIALFQTIAVLADNITYIYKDYFKFELPNTLELEYDDNINSSCYAQSNDVIHINKTLGSERVAWCQKGLNKPQNKEVFEKYCRVITTVEQLQAGDVPARYEDFKMDEETWESFFGAAKEECESIGLKIIKRCSFGKIDFNGYPGLYISYLRTGWKDAPPVLVYRYTIFDGDKFCTLIFSYRDSEAELWSDVKNTIAKTFTFDIGSTTSSSFDNSANKTSAPATESNEATYVIGVFLIVVLIIFIATYIYYKKEEKL